VITTNLTTWACFILFNKSMSFSSEGTENMYVFSITWSPTVHGNCSQSSNWGTSYICWGACTRLNL